MFEWIASALSFWANPMAHHLTENGYPRRKPCPECGKPLFVDADGWVSCPRQQLPTDCFYAKKRSHPGPSHPGYTDGV